MKELNSPILVITGGGSNGGKVMKRLTVAKISAMIAHLLSWIPLPFFLFGPTYRGAEITPEGIVQKTATLVDMNGLWVVWLLLVPISLSCVASVGVIMTRLSWRRRLIMIWVGTSLLLLFCLIGLASIGLVYLPSLLVLVLAAGIQIRAQRAGIREEIKPSGL